MTRDIERIVTCLKNSVRFKEFKNPNNDILPDSLTQPLSARLIYHPLLSEENLRAIAPDYKDWIYPDWDNATNYVIGDRVTGSDAKRYEALTDNIGVDPIVQPSTDWQTVDLFALWLDNVREEGVRNYISSIFTTKKEDRQTKTLLDNYNLYDRPGRITDLIVKQDRVVGYEIELLNHNNINVVLERIRTQFTEINTDLTFRLHHSSQKDPVASFDITTTQSSSEEWWDISDQIIDLQYRDFANNITGGYWYLTYREDELTGQAINARYLWGRPPCRTCNSSNYNYWYNWSQFVSIRTIFITNGKYPSDNSLWDLNNVTYSKDSTFGLNLTLSAYCELKELLCEQPEVFAEGIAQQVTVDLLQEVANSSRSNVLSEKTRQLAQISLIDAEDIGKQGEIAKLDALIDTGNFELSDLQKSSCLPCLPSKGMSQTSVQTGQRGRRFGHHARYF